MLGAAVPVPFVDACSNCTFLPAPLPTPWIELLLYLAIVLLGVVILAATGTWLVLRLRRSEHARRQRRAGRIAVAAAVLFVIAASMNYGVTYFYELDQSITVQP